MRTRMLHLKPSTVTSDEMLENWRVEHPKLQGTLQLLALDWPQGLAAVYCLAEYLTPCLYLEQERLFDIALCNALGAYRDARAHRDRERLDDFLHDLTWGASCSLLGWRLLDVDGDTWRVEDGMYLGTWLLRRRGRWQRWLRGEIQLQAVATQSTARQLQQVLRSGITTTDVGILLDGSRCG
jgi:hypothetical protein